MLPHWEPETLKNVIPFVIGCVGARRTGKSTAISHLLFQMSTRFELVICFIGSAACNPTIEAMMERFWDPRFFFSEWDQHLIDTLLKQQEALKKSGRDRQVCILVDDVILSSNAEEQLAHMALRGRHFNISLAMCSVSYTSLPKRARRSLDCLLVFSLPMQSDMKVLTWEYTQKARMARFQLAHLQDYECLVLETLQKRQKLFVWKADYVSLSDLRKTRESQGSPERGLSKTLVSSETPSEHHTEPRQERNVGVKDRIQSLERPPASSFEKRSDGRQPRGRGNVGANH